MTREEWLALNGGKLVGTDLRPPETDGEIAAWISERKKRWPSAKRVEEKEREDSERKQRAQMRWDAEEARRAEEKRSRLAGAQKAEAEKTAAAGAGGAAKRKRKPRDGDGSDGGGDGDDDESGSSPEELSAHMRHVFRDDRRKAPGKPKTALCRQHASSGSCPRGTECPFVHDQDARSSQSRKKEKRVEDQRTKQEKSRPSLYQRVRVSRIFMQFFFLLFQTPLLTE